MWTIAAVNKKLDGPLGTYNGLADIHLAHYFSRPSRQSHLKAAKLISKDGTIIPEQKVKLVSLQHEKKKRMYDILADTVIQNAAHKEGTWNMKLSSYLEDISKMEKAEKIKVECQRNFQNVTSKSLVNCLTFPPCKHRNLDNSKEQDIGINLPSLPRSAPSTCKCYKSPTSPLQSNLANMKRCVSANEMSPYIFPACLSNTYLQQSQNNLHHTISLHQKKKKRKKRSAEETEKKNSPKVVSATKLAKLSLPDQNFTVNQCRVTLYYHGHAPSKPKKVVWEDILIQQQHCGGTPVIIYKGQITRNETLTFISLSHNGFTFSITLFLDGIRHLKLSSCCVFRYACGKRLGGTSGIFSIKNIEGGKPCPKCQYKQIDICSKDLKQKLMCSDNYMPMNEKEETQFQPSIVKKEEKYDAEEDESIAEVNNKDISNEEENENSIESDVIKSDVEEVEESLGVGSEHNNTLSDEEVEEENEISETNMSVDQDEIVPDAPGIAYDSDSSTHSVAESVENKVISEVPVLKPYETESSEEDEGAKQIVIQASVYGSPTNR